MKVSIFAVTVSAALFSLSSAGLAATGFSIADVNDAGKIATGAFASANADHAEHFVGYKAWKSGEEAKVKIYVDHDGMNMEFNYNCHKHNVGVECHAQ